MDDSIDWFKDGVPMVQVVTIKEAFASEGFEEFVKKYGDVEIDDELFNEFLVRLLPKQQ